MRSFLIVLLSSACLPAQAVYAAEAGPDTAAVDAAAPHETDDAAGADAAIVVFGKGQTRQVQEIKAEDIRILTPGSSPLLAIAKLPSVNVQSADAFGAYE